MKLDFGNITIERFKSFNKKCVINLARGVGLHFVKGLNNAEPELGANGAGKSSIFDALSWSMYGKTVDGLRNPDLKPWGNGSGQTSVRLMLHIDDEGHKIARTASPNALSLNGKPIDQPALERLLGLSFESFKQTILLGQGQPLFVDLSPRDKMSLLADVLELDRWEQRSDHAKLEASNIRQHIDRLHGSLAPLESLIKQIREQIDVLSIKHDTWEKENFKEVLEAKAELSKVEVRFKVVDLRRSKIELELDSAQTEAKGEQQLCEKLNSKLHQANLVKAKFDRDLALAQHKAKAIKDDLSNLGESDKCPSCGQPIKGTSLAKHKIELENRWKAASKTYLNMIEPKLSKQRDAIWKQLGEAEERVKTFSNKADVAHDALDNIFPEHAELKTKISFLKKSIIDKEGTENPYVEQLKGLRESRDKLKGKLAKTNEDIKVSEQEYKHVEYWVKGFKDVRLFILEDILQELEMASNIMLDQLGMLDWSIHYDVEKETQAGTVQRGLNVNILSPSNKAPVRFECWSGGEGQRLRLVVSLALSEVLLNHAGVDPSLEILDEPTRGLSREGRADLIEMLASRAKQVDRVTLLADHTTVESSLFKPTVTIVKDKQGSYLS